MTRFVPTAVAAVFLLASSVTASVAEDTHHPEETPQSAPSTPTAPSAPQNNQMPSSGMMGGGMMGGGMMGGGMMGGGMMGGGMMGADGMMSMMKNMMMDMMGQMSGSNMAMPGMDMADHVEGRIAFLRTELKISDAQTKAWNDFAQALRNNAKKLTDLRASSAPVPPLVKQLEQQERWYAARIEGIRAIKTTFERLYSALSPDQQKQADQLMGPHLGLMPMAMMSMGGMSSRQMPAPMKPTEPSKP